jgi:Uma2 family endonuclease
MAETDLHRDDMVDLIERLKNHFVRDRMIYVSGNLLVFYEEGNRRKHVSPDVFVVRGVANKRRDNYLIWQEGKGPDAIIEVTSKSTRREDKKKKWELYRDVLKVREYFLFDPTEDYLKPLLQGFRLEAGDYVPIEPVDGRLPSEVLGLHLERDHHQLRLYDPATQSWVKKADEQRADAERQRADAAEAAAERIAAEFERLRREVEALRRPASEG